MSYSILVLSPDPQLVFDWLTSQSKQNTPFRLFFYREGVRQSQNVAHQAWVEFLQQQNLNCEMICCSGSMERRQLSIPSDSCFAIGGLGLLAECFKQCDEVIQIG